MSFGAAKEQVLPRTAPLMGRAFAYGAYMAGCAAMVTFFVLTCEDDEELRRRVTEGGVIENLQAVHLGFAALLFAVAAWMAFRQGIEERWLAVQWSLLMLFTLNRELDGMWEGMALDVVYDSLKILLALPAVMILVLRKALTLNLWLRRPLWAPFLLTFIGIGVYGLAQVAGNLLRRNDWNTASRRTVQESVELFAGVFFIFAAVELIARMWKREGTKFR